MKKNYQKPTIESVVILNKQHLLVGSEQGEESICTNDNSCPTFTGGGL
jgi:hypothetical protein